MELNNKGNNYTKNYLPSKKIQYLILALVIIGVLTWVVPKITTYFREHRASFSINGKPPEPLIASASTPSNFDKDSDGDGIADWQENLFGFDPNKKDSDGDGIADALPMVDGASIGTKINIPDTDKLMLAVYAKFQNTPTDEIKPEDVQQVISDEVLAHAESIEVGFKKYKTIDLELTDSDTASIAAYQKTVYSLFDTISDPAIFAKNIQDKILKGDNNVTAEIATLNIMVTKFLTTPVPTLASNLHLSLINAAYFIIQDLEIPPSTDELTIYTQSLIAQKNINLVQETLVDIATLAKIYTTN